MMSQTCFDTIDTKVILISFKIAGKGYLDNIFIRKSVIGTDIHIEVNTIRLTLDRVLKQFPRTKTLRDQDF